MEQEKYYSLGDSYTEIQGDETEVIQFRDAIFSGKI